VLGHFSSLLTTPSQTGKPMSEPLRLLARLQYDRLGVSYKQAGPVIVPTYLFSVCRTNLIGCWLLIKKVN